MNHKLSLQYLSLFLLALNLFCPSILIFQKIFDHRLETCCGEGGFVVGRWKAQKDRGRLTVILRTLK